MPVSTVWNNLIATRWELLAITALASSTFALAASFFYWYTTTGEVALLLLGWVTFGTAFDFYSHLLGHSMRNYPRFLQAYARVNFAALCFGIPFTVLAASFVMAAVVPTGLNASLVQWWPQILVGSLLFGALFLFSRYKQYSIDGSVEFTLDKEHRFTRAVWLMRRGYLAASLLVPILVVVDSIGAGWEGWAITFAVSFAATVPLHIMHKHIPSMLSEAITLYILACGSYIVFVAN